MEEQVKTQQPKKRGGKWLVLLVLVVAAALIALWQLDVLPKRGGYQAVFLTNNQVYFGKLSREASRYAVLTDIYYLRITQQLQPPEQGQQQPPQINLVKLGNELHGPKDEMRINRDHILFIEDLKPDSAVVKAINDFKAQQK